MARGIGDNKGAFGCREKPVGDVDSYALLPFVLQPVQQQRKIDVFPGGAEPARFLLERRQLVFQDQCAVIEEPTNQRRLAVVDRSAGQEAQEILVALRGSLRASCHQK